MKKVIVALAAVAMVGVATADIYVAPSVGFGIYGDGNNGGIIDNNAGVEVVLQIIDGGGDGVSAVTFDLAGNPVAGGNDSIIGFLVSAATGGGDYADYGALIAGEIGGNGTPWSADTWVAISGIVDGRSAWLAPIAITDGNYSDPKTLPEVLVVDGGVGATANTIVTVIPEPATIGLMGIAGLGMFLARKKVRA